MDELKRSSHKIDNLTGLLEKANDRVDKALLESEMHQEENIELKKMNATLRQCLNLMNSRVFGSSKSQKGIGKKKPVRGKHDDKDGHPDKPRSKELVVQYGLADFSAEPSELGG